MSLFWWTVLILVFSGTVLGFIAEGPNGLAMSLLMIVLVLPGVQLGAAIAVALILAASARPDKSQQLRQISKIALGVVLGTIAGILAMAALCFLPLLNR